MTILVTGASGGFGKVFLPLLRNYYSEPVVGTSRAKAANFDYLSCDLTDESAVRVLLKTVQPRIIFHLAASFTGQFNVDYQINTLSAKYIFDSILSENLTTRVILFGSAAEYGVVLPTDNPIPEAFPCRPVSIYGLTKAFQTDVAKYYARAHKLDAVIARVFNLALPGLSERLFYGRAESLIRAYKHGGITELKFGDLSSKRDYINLQQASSQILAVAKHGVAGEIYNVGSGVAVDMRSILVRMLQAEDMPQCKVVETRSEAIGRKGYDVPVIYADIKKVSALLIAAS
jgi:nucleoside-diphosphate-sugar epimerase